MSQYQRLTRAALPRYVRQVWWLCDKVLKPAFAVRQAWAAASLQGTEHPDIAPCVCFAQVAASVRGVLHLIHCISCRGALVQRKALLVQQG
jgi:hypothetical protein